MTDYYSIQKKRNYIVGAFVFVAFAAFIWMLVRFRDLPLFISKANSFYVVVNFHDAPGVQKETPIQFCGYQIGRVIVVSPPLLVKDKETGKEWHEVGVTMAIDKKYKNIPSNVEVMLMKRGLGSSYIELRADPDKPLTPLIAERPETVYLCQAMEVKGSLGVSSDFFPPQVQKKIEDLVDSIGLLAENTNQIIGDEQNKANIKKTLEQIAITTEQARSTLKSVQSLSDVGSQEIVKIAENLDATLSQLHQILAKINDGDGAAGKLVNDGRLYENLLDSSGELQMALEQIKKWAADAREKGVRIKW
jgi:phospholipid/cholesterol/gamma-HCH transport system substrate-binding protein